MNIFILDQDPELAASYHNEDAVKAYRTYYLNDKRHIAKWKNRDQPEWWK